MKINITDYPAIYINLENEKDRKYKCEKELKTFGFKNIIRMDAVFDEVRSRGCSKSHFLALTKIPAPFIIFEDDIEVSEIKHEFEIPDDADALYLGLSSWWKKENSFGYFPDFDRLDDNISKIRGMLSGHAILYLNQKYVDICAKGAKHHGYDFYSAGFSDHAFADLQRHKNVYAVNSPLFFQNSQKNVTIKKIGEQHDY